MARLGVTAPLRWIDFNAKTGAIFLIVFNSLLWYFYYKKFIPNNLFNLIIFVFATLFGIYWYYTNFIKKK